MEDSWSLISVVKECSRKTQSRAPEVEGGLNISATTARPTTVDKVTNYLPNHFSDQFGAGSSSGQPFQNLQNPYVCNQFNAGTNSNTRTTRLATGVGNTDYLPNPFSNQFGAGTSSSGEQLQNLENILFSDDQFNASNAITTTTSAQPTTVVEIDDDYLPNPFSDQFGASNNSSGQNLQNSLFCDQFDASATNTSFQDLLFSVEFGAGTNNINSSMQSPLISHQSDANTSNAFSSVLPVASTAEGNVCGNNLRDYMSQPALLFQPAAAAAPAPVISTPAGPLLQEFKEVPDTPDHMFSQCQGSCSCPDGFHCGLGKKRSVYIMDIEELKGLDDKWAWRKYGQKPIRGSPYPRNYYKCSSKKNCMAKKQVERSYEDPEKYIVTYIGQHYHPFPPPRTNNGGPRPKSNLDLPQETESPATRMVTQSGGPSGSGCGPKPRSGSGSRSGSGEMGGDGDGEAAGGCDGNIEEPEENNYKIVIPEAVVDMDSLWGENMEGMVVEVDSLWGENMEGMVVEERRKIDDVNDDFFDVILHESGYGYEYGYGYEKNMSVCYNGVQENGRTENGSENIGGGNPKTTLAPATLMVGANEPPRNEACNIWGW